MSQKTYLINSSTAITSGAFGYYIETLQQKVQNQQTQWHPLLGQGSDIAAGAMFTALFLIYYRYTEQKQNTKLLDWTAPAAAGALCTFGELTGIMGETFDPKDIAAYWMGTGIAYLAHRAFAANMLEKKIAAQDI